MVSILITSSILTKFSQAVNALSKSWLNWIKSESEGLVPASFPSQELNLMGFIPGNQLDHQEGTADHGPDTEDLQLVYDHHGPQAWPRESKLQPGRAVVTFTQGERRSWASLVA